ncbi:hypothetical protein G6O69_34950 [Pseudenhygromyxa sp. WMMC2535]|uniref:hypothetical protein n=1 Tax=Pseudenhygromyxa sp. WMMC2535 TaxID=2712867 RepID=UPI0015536132|nr:hypothetical protein [Pseudenhygromyxa sp. WMMC2535]NVB43074.1 hypothetical protein [Pseudenhygromyxa sp. WMMC2535]
MPAGDQAAGSEAARPELGEGALEELDALLALASAGPLGVDACLRMAALVEQVPGRAPKVASALGRQRDAAAVEGLLALPVDTRGVVEGLYAALRCGARREQAAGGQAPRMIALEFRSSRSRRFPRLVERAHEAFGGRLERLRIDDVIHYRVALLDAEPGGEGEGGEDADALAPAASLRRRVQPLELDLLGLHRDMQRLRGVRLWLNGWRFDDGGPLRPAAREPLLRGWLEGVLEG